MSLLSLFVSDHASIQATGDLLLTIRSQVVVPAVLALSPGAFMYYYLFFRSGLIPRWLSGWGIAAIVLTMGACVSSWFSRSPLIAYDRVAPSRCSGDGAGGLVDRKRLQSVRSWGL